MGERDIGMDPFEAVAIEVQGAEKWRAGSHRMNGRAGIVNKAGKGKLRGTDGTARRILGLEDENAQAGACKKNGSGKTVRTRTDDNGIMSGGSHA